MMLTFFAIVYLYINIKIFKNELKINKKTGLLLAVTIILGFLTQYLFIVYASLVSVVMIALYAINKQYKDMFKYIGILIISVAIGLLIFPFSINHILFSNRRITGLQELDYLGKLMEYFKLILRYFGSNFEIVLALFAIALLSILIKRKKERGLMTLIILPTILYIMVTAQIIEVLALKYVMIILPIIAIMIIMAISTIFENEKYIDDWNYIERSIQEFMKYDKTLLLNDTELETLVGDKELEDKNEFILSVNFYMNPEKVVQEVLEKTEYTKYELIFEGVEGIDQKIYKIYR